MLPACGYTTAKAYCAAITASKAFPPIFRTFAPASLAKGCAETTRPLSFVRISFTILMSVNCANTKFEEIRSRTSAFFMSGNFYQKY